MCMFGYLKTPDIILPLVSSRKLDWTHTFDTHCIFRLYFVVRQCIKYLVSLLSSLHSYNKQFTSWLVRLYDFYYSLVVKDH